MCDELARSGIDIEALLAFAVALLALSSLAAYKFRKAIYWVLIIVTAGSLFAFSPPSVAAGPLNNCTPNEQTTSHDITDGNSSNSALAIDDGPFLLGTDHESILMLDILRNDTAGTSSFDVNTIDLDPSSPEIDNYFYYDNGTFSASFSHIGGGIIEVMSFGAQPGDSIAIPYRVSTFDGTTTNIADIIINFVDWVAQGNVLSTCNYSDGTENITDNDAHPDGINVATVDLDPSTPGRQTTYTSAKGTVFSVDDFGVIQYTLPGNVDVPDDLAEFFDQIFYTVESSNGAVSNQAPITVIYGFCG